MNPMLQALVKSRSAAPSVPQSAAPDSAAPAAEGPGDALLAKLAGLESKLDKICAALNISGHDGDAPADKDAPEAPPNDDGY